MTDSGFDLRQAREAVGLSQAKLAELSGVSQHTLSAFELGKADLSRSIIRELKTLLNDDSSVRAIASRKKRYREHQYTSVAHEPLRVARASRTPENSNYLASLATLKAEPAGDRATGTALSLFSGCGGFSLGFAAAGFQILGSLEINDGLRDIYQRNMPSVRKLGTDITELSMNNILELHNTLDRIDVLIGGPPCQGFSLSGKRRTDDPRNRLFEHYLQFVDVFQPRVAIIENVRLLTSMKSPNGGLVKDEITADFARHGYRVGVFEVNAKNYGVPQHRERVFFMAIRGDINAPPSFPEPTHGEGVGLFSSRRPCRTFADACSDLPYLESGEASDVPLHKAVRHPAHVIEWLWEVPEGASAHDNEDPAMRPPSGYNTTYKRQVWSEPAATVQTTFGMISGCRNVHPIATRSLTIREAARVQSFPDRFQFPGKDGVVRTGIGNAVPPLLAKYIAEHIAEYYC